MRCISRLSSRRRIDSRLSAFCLPATSATSTSPEAAGVPGRRAVRKFRSDAFVPRALPRARENDSATMRITTRHTSPHTPPPPGRRNAAPRQPSGDARARSHLQSVLAVEVRLERYDRLARAARRLGVELANLRRRRANMLRSWRRSLDTRVGKRKARSPPRASFLWSSSRRSRFCSCWKYAPVVSCGAMSTPSSHKPSGRTCGRAHVGGGVRVRVRARVRARARVCACVVGATRLVGARERDRHSRAPSGRAADQDPPPTRTHLREAVHDRHLAVAARLGFGAEQRDAGLEGL